MSPKQPLQVHAYDDLLILYWRRVDKIAGQINIFLDGVQLAKPILGVEFLERPDYILAAYAEGLSSRQAIAIRIADTDGNTLAESESDRAKPFPKKLIASWSGPSRMRVAKMLILQTEKNFPQLSKTTKRKIASNLAGEAAAVVWGEEGLAYFRVPWPGHEATGLISATLQAMPQPAELPESVNALQEGGFLHFFSRQAMAVWRRDRVWVVKTGEARCLPFYFQEPTRQPAPFGPAAWLNAVVAGYTGNQNLLKGFVASVVGLPKRPEQQRLLGKVEGMRLGKVIGWAFDPGQPHSPARLSVRVDGQEQDSIEAHLPRSDSDLRAYGNCGFVWQPDEALLSGAAREIRFYCLDTGCELDGSPVKVGDGEYDGELRIDDAGQLIGWVSERRSAPRPLRIALLVDGERYADIPASQVEAPRPDGRLIFRCELPDQVFDTAPHAIDVELSAPGGLARPLNRAVPIQAGYRGYLETANLERLGGWILNTAAPNRPVPLELLVNGACVATAKADLMRQDPAEQMAGAERCGFEFKVPLRSLEYASLSMSLRLAGTSIQVLGPPILFTHYDIALRTLSTLAEILNDPARWQSLAGGLAFDEDVTTWLRTQVIARATAELRRAKRIPSKIELQLTPLIRMPQRANREPVVDVIVPVYLGREDSLRCIASVLESPCQTPMELVVINDASPDLDLSLELRRMAAEHGFTLLENKDNLGFVATVNRGMRLHLGRDVVLLNSDTVVAEGWLDRLRAAAQRAENIGTATPFSNNATICSFPVFCRENPMPPGLSVERLDRLFAQANQGIAVDIPTAVGFCMYIRRDALDEVGYFDEAQWGKGYGEENDFCLRASALGWRHVAACDVFVEHEGGVSFAEGKKDQLQRNLSKLNGLYPDYPVTIQRFIHQDPMAEARNRVAKALLREHSPRYMLFVIHGLGGGTQSAADHLAARLAVEGVAVLALMSVTAGRWRLEGHGLPYAIHYCYPDDWEAMLEDLRDLGIWHIHYHQTMHYPKRIWGLPESLNVAYDFTAHDYLPICPRINMIDETGYYCGESQLSADNCTRCVKLNGLDHDLDDKYLEFGNDVGHWRAVYRQVLSKARLVFAPSQDVAQRYQAHFNLDNLKTVPHLEPRHEIPPLRKGDHRTVAVIGAIGSHKGRDILLRCVRNAEKEGLPLRFAIIGFTSDDRVFGRFDNVTIYGAYERENLPRLIEMSQARVALFLSPWPETYCFALSEAWQNGLYPVALDIGALGERIRQVKYGRLLPLNASPRRINRALLKVLEAGIEPPGQPFIGWDVPDVLKDYYGLAMDADE